MLRILRNYRWTQSQGHHAIDRLEERGVGKDSFPQSTLKGRDMSIVNQNYPCNCFKAITGPTSERRGWGGGGGGEGGGGEGVMDISGCL